jgi:hypothetical protein
LVDATKLLTFLGSTARPIGSGERAAVALQQRRPGETVNAKIRRKDRKGDGENDE